MFALLSLSIKLITNLIYDKKLYLFAKDAFIKMISFKEIKSSYTKYKLQVRLLIGHYIHLLSVFASFSFELAIWAANKRSKAAFVGI